MFETVIRDLRIGMRVLVKEKCFCALAVIVLGLGICGVTTMFSVVNGVMLRGFSFPNAERLASVNLIDPTSANFFGVNGQVSPMDYEEMLPAAEVVRAAGRATERLDGQRDRRRTAAAIYGRVHHRGLPADPRRLAAAWAAISQPPTTRPARTRSR